MNVLATLLLIILLVGGAFYALGPLAAGLALLVSVFVVARQADREEA